MKHKFVLDFLLNRFGPPSENDIDIDDSRFSVLPNEDAYVLESVAYGRQFNLYSIKSIPDNASMYVLSEPDVGGLSQLYLFDEDKDGNILLDTMALDPRSDTQLTSVKLNGHLFLRMDFAVHGSGYLDEQLVLLGIIKKSFHNVFETSLLEAND
ncbi:MAG TPA: hypothetical protein VLX91_09555, partial [Candidatus Acidoferrales bacterium]|nr:hypothetical protein [Candidatus Acidoferrales bacterium]